VTFAGGALAVAQHELLRLRRAPIVLGMGVLFWVVQGLAFAGQVTLLSDPSRPAPLGAVLGGYFAGNLLSWTAWLAVLAALAVHAVGDDRRSGAWELLVTGPVGDGAAVVGSWLAAALVQALLWLPTLAYLGVLLVFAAPGSSWGWGPIALAYVAAVGIGAALLALAMAVAARVAHPVVGFVTSFAALLVLIVLGDVGAVGGDLRRAVPGLADILVALDLRALMATAARGEARAASVVLVLGLVVSGLCATVVALGRGRRRERWRRLATLSTTLVALAATLAWILVARAGARVDLSADGAATVHASTRAILRAAPGDVQLTVVRPQLASFATIYAEVERVVARLADVAPRVRVTRVDAALAPGPAQRLAREAGLADADLLGSGALVVTIGGRTRVVDLLELVDVGRDALAAPTVSRLAVEAAVASRVRELSSGAWSVCAFGGAGQASLGAQARDERIDTLGWRDVGDRLRWDGATVREVVAVDATALAGCDVLVVAGGSMSLADGEALAGSGAARPPMLIALDRDAPGPGLVALLSTRGVQVAGRAVDDVSSQLDDTGRFRVIDGYAAHPANDGFQRRRATVWRSPVELAATAPAVPLLSTSAQGRSAAGDAARARVLAAASDDGSRLVVLGTADLDPVASGGANALWVVQAIRWAAGRERIPSVDGVRVPEVVRLRLTPRERSWVWLGCAVVLPLAFAAPPVLLGWRRRRRERREAGGA
jgi:ABC-2 type transport system permease protein